MSTSNKIRKIDDGTPVRFHSPSSFRHRFVSSFKLSNQDISQIMGGKKKGDEISELIQLFIREKGRFRNNLRAQFVHHVEVAAESKMENDHSRDVVNAFKTLFRDIFPSAYFSEITMKDMFTALSTRFFTGSFVGKFLKVYQEIRRDEESELLSSLDETGGSTDLTNYRICGKNIPYDVAAIIISYLPKNYELISSIGCLNQGFFYLILTCWKHVTITPKNVKSISLLVYRCVRSITLKGKFRSSQLKFVFDHVDRKRIVKANFFDVKVFPKLFNPKNLDISLPACEELIIPYVSDLKKIRPNYYYPQEKSSFHLAQDSIFRKFVLENIKVRSLKTIDHLFPADYKKLAEENEDFDPTSMTEFVFRFRSHSKIHDFLHNDLEWTRKYYSCHFKGNGLVKIMFQKHDIVINNRFAQNPPFEEIWKLHPLVERLMVDFCSASTLWIEEPWILDLSLLGKLRELKIVEDRAVQNTVKERNTNPRVWKKVIFSDEIKKGGRFGRFVMECCTVEEDFMCWGKKQRWFQEEGTSVVEFFADVVEQLKECEVESMEMRCSTAKRFVELRHNHFRSLQQCFDQFDDVIERIFDETEKENFLDDVEEKEKTLICPIVSMFLQGKGRKLVVQLDGLHPFLSFEIEKKRGIEQSEYEKILSRGRTKYIKQVPVYEKGYFQGNECVVFTIHIDGNEEEMVEEQRAFLIGMKESVMTKVNHMDNIKKQMWISMFRASGKRWRQHFFSKIQVFIVRSLRNELKEMKAALRKTRTQNEFSIHRVEICSESVFGVKLNYPFTYIVKKIDEK